MAQQEFGKTPDGTPVQLYTLANKQGVEAKITNYGGIVVSLRTPDRNGKSGDVTLGYDNFEGYTKVNPYFGAIVGRYGKSHRARAFQAERGRVQVGAEQRRKRAARRSQGLR